MIFRMMMDGSLVLTALIVLLRKLLCTLLCPKTWIYSFKLKGTGFRCEYGTDLYYSNVLWVNGPFLPGKYNDNQIFSGFGLKALADKTHIGHPDQCSTFNAINSSTAQ